MGGTACKQDKGIYIRRPVQEVTQYVRAPAGTQYIHSIVAWCGVLEEKIRKTWGSSNLCQGPHGVRRISAGKRGHRRARLLLSRDWLGNYRHGSNKNHSDGEETWV